MSSSVIHSINALQIYDSRGKPTLEVHLATEDGKTFRASVPSGASTGIYEARELRDGNPKEFLGQGVSTAINNVNSIIAPALIAANLNVCNQAEIDNFLINLDGTENKDKLGANAILGVSLAVSMAGAAAKSVPLYQHIADLSGNSTVTLPIPSLNVINGGMHAGNKLAFQEFMIMPVGAKTFQEAMRMGSEVYQHLKSLIKKNFGQDAINVGDEGGFAPNVDSVEHCVKLLVEAISIAGYTGKIKLALDVAASEFYIDGKYDLDFKTQGDKPHRIVSGVELAEIYLDLINRYPIVSIEDPFDQDDWESWSYLTSKTSIQVVGDDLTVTNPKRIQTALDKKACRSLLLKVNQIGTLTESIEAANMVKKNGWGVMISHRSGETEDSFIADLAAGINAGQIKSGAPCRSERLAKYNRLLRIEAEMGDKAVYSQPTQLGL